MFSRLRLPSRRPGVEHESVLRELVREILTAHGYRFLEAADAVKALNNHQPQL
jgi:CheY-like chemotaxis protein